MLAARRAGQYAATRAQPMSAGGGTISRDRAERRKDAGKRHRERTVPELCSSGILKRHRFVLLPFSPGLKVALKQAINEAEAFGHEDVVPAHLRLACLVQGETNPAAHLVIDAGLSTARIPAIILPVGAHDFYRDRRAGHQI
jgi:hypothetical protein